MTGRNYNLYLCGYFCISFDSTSFFSTILFCKTAQALNLQTHDEWLSFKSCHKCWTEIWTLTWSQDRKTPTWLCSMIKTVPIRHFLTDIRYIYIPFLPLFHTKQLDIYVMAVSCCLALHQLCRWWSGGVLIDNYNYNYSFRPATAVQGSGSSLWWRGDLKNWLINWLQKSVLFIYYIIFTRSCIF